MIGGVYYLNGSDINLHSICLFASFLPLAYGVPYMWTLFKMDFLVYYLEMQFLGIVCWMNKLMKEYSEWNNKQASHIIHGNLSKSPWVQTPDVLLLISSLYYVLCFHFCF